MWYRGYYPGVDNTNHDRRNEVSDPGYPPGMRESELDVLIDTIELAQCAGDCEVETEHYVTAHEEGKGWSRTTYQCTICEAEHTEEWTDDDYAEQYWGGL